MDHSKEPHNPVNSSSTNSVRREPASPPVTMTSDYVDAVLFQLRWEAIDDRDGYFMGCYDTPEPSNDESDDANCKFGPFSSVLVSRAKQTHHASPQAEYHGAACCASSQLRRARRRDSSGPVLYL